MKKIAGILIDFGQDFQYENYGSEGEKIVSFTCNIEVVRQNGEIHFDYCGQETIVDDNDEEAMDKIAKMVEYACIQETT